MTIIPLSILILTFPTNLYVPTIYYTFVIRVPQLTYDEFEENIDELISQYRKDFSVPVFTDW